MDYTNNACISYQLRWYEYMRGVKERAFADKTPTTLFCTAHRINCSIKLLIKSLIFS